jgi:hypothetical protein
VAQRDRAARELQKELVCRKSWPLKTLLNWENITPRDENNLIPTLKISNNVLGFLFPKFRLRNYCTISSLRTTFSGKFCPRIFRYLMRTPPEEFRSALSVPKSLWRRNGTRLFLITHPKHFISNWRCKNIWLISHSCKSNRRIFRMHSDSFDVSLINCCLPHIPINLSN